MRAETSPTARALLTLELIQNQPGITADRIAERLGVTSRAARRYVAILREADIPIESVSGPAGGYRPGRGVRLAPLTFSSAEALGLVMAVLDGHHDVADTQDPASSALTKILRGLPESIAAQADTVRTTAAAAPDRAAARPDPVTTATLVEACAQGQRLRLTYRSEAGLERDLEVDPWSVVVRHGRWYLLCWSHTSGAVRVYRVDRVLATVPLPGRVERPADLEPVAALERHFAIGWEYDVEVVIDAPLAEAAGFVPTSLGHLSEVDAGQSRLTGSTSNPSWYAEQLVRIRVPYRIEGCPELARAARRLGDALVAAASGTAGSDSASSSPVPADAASSSALDPSRLREPLSVLRLGERVFQVERAARADVPAILGLLREDEIGATREADDLAVYDTAFAAVDRDPAQLLLAVRDADGSVVATTQLTLIPGLSRAGATRMLIEGVRVAGSTRGTGLGTALMEWALDWGRAQGADLAQLTSDKRRADAHRFYARVGFVASHEGMKRDLA